jgi:hypothetical protein
MYDLERTDLNILAFVLISNRFYKKIDCHPLCAGVSSWSDRKDETGLPGQVT